MLWLTDCLTAIIGRYYPLWQNEVESKGPTTPNKLT